MMPRTALAFSAGLNATCLLWDLLEAGHEVTCIHVNYGQPAHAEEVAAARVLVTMANAGALRPRVELVEARALPAIGAGGFREYALLALGVAASHAMDRECQIVACGVDQQTGVDSFFHPFANLLHELSGGEIGFLAPYRHLYKPGVVRGGQMAPMRWSWSCLSPPSVTGGTHCGTCPGCWARVRAFELAGWHDWTEYRAEKARAA